MQNIIAMSRFGLAGSVTRGPYNPPQAGWCGAHTFVR